MRIFLMSWSGKEVGMIEIVKRLKEGGHEIVYWVCDFGKEADYKTFPGTIFHDHYEAIAGKPAPGVNAEEFPSVGRDAIQQFYATESVVLTMMNKRLGHLAINERKHLYYHILQYWRGVFDKYNPDAILFLSAPHALYDYIVYALAKSRNVKTLVVEVSVVNDRLLLYEDFKDGHPSLKPQVWKNQSGKFSVANLSEDLRDYYSKHRKLSQSPEDISDFRDATYKEINVFLKGRFGAAHAFKERLRLIVNSAKDLSLPKKSIRFFINRLGPNMKKEYLSVQSPPDFSRNFVYVPLHTQPEQNTVTQGDVFVDQLLMLEILAASLPKGWLIYVKEHPFQWLPRGPAFFNDRPRGYYKSIAALKNARIMPIGTNTFELIHYAKAAAAVTGTAAWEAVMRSKPALLFGHVWFQNSPGVFRVDSVESCRRAFAEIETWRGFDEAELIKFLTAFDKASFRGYTDQEYAACSDLSREENINNFLRAIYEQL
ncbi:MAG: hypothetical protein HYW15_01765 [Candidatus Giovannonibacteria bacterium]|nr:MAG: hypothetical protein HYW15_01765 [Candidatus Giovannonibacteria bacterium]